MRQISLVELLIQDLGTSSCHKNLTRSQDLYKFPKILPRSWTMGLPFRILQDLEEYVKILTNLVKFLWQELVLRSWIRNSTRDIIRRIDRDICHN